MCGIRLGPFYHCNLLRARNKSRLGALSVIPAGVTSAILQPYEIYISGLVFNGSETRAQNNEIT